MGEQPFQGKDIMSTLLAVGSHQPAPPTRLDSRMPRVLSDLVMRLLEKEAARRPTSAGEVVVALRALEEKLARQQAGRKRVLLVLAVTLIALVPLTWWLATVVLRIETATGTLVVAMNDAETETRIKNGKLVLTGPDGKVRYTLSRSERNKKIDAGPYHVRVEGADGLAVDTPEFTLKKDGKVVVRVTAARRAVAKNSDPDRRAAEWVLSIGGVVKVNGQDTEIRLLADLPREHFQLTCAILHLNQRASDHGLVHFKECKHLTSLHLAGTRLSDAGLARFKDCKNLTILNLKGTKVTDLSPLKGMPLKELFCDFNPQRDAAILRSITTLETINGKPAKEFWQEVEARKR
jgi:hypothetical protein